MTPSPEALAERLDTAARTAKPTGDLPEMSFAQSLAVQRGVLNLHAERGDARVGVKLAFTNRAMMERFGIREPALGGLTASMQQSDGGSIAAATLIRPRIECELIVRLRNDLPAGASREDALASIESVAPAIEIIDARFTGAGFRLTDVVADNASAAAFVTGTWQAVTGALDGRAVYLSVNDRVVANGSTSAIFGHPLDALRIAADLAERNGEPLRASMVVLLGSATDPFTADAGSRITARIEGLGTVSFNLTSPS